MPLIKNVLQFIVGLGILLYFLASLAMFGIFFLVGVAGYEKVDFVTAVIRHPTYGRYFIIWLILTGVALVYNGVREIRKDSQNDKKKREQNGTD